MSNTKIIATAEAENKGEMYSTNMKVRQHLLVSDELPEYGGKDTGPSPGDYLCMALASCKVITLRMYAERKKWKVDAIKIKVDHVKGANMATGNNTFFCEVSFTGELTDEQKQRLLEIAKVCPIQKLLLKANDIVTIIV